MDLLQGITVAFLLLIGLAGTVLWLRRRGLATFHFPTSSGTKPRRMQVIERVALTPHHALHLVRVDDQTILVATAPSGCSVIHSGDSQ